MLLAACSPGGGGGSKSDVDPVPDLDPIDPPDEKTWSVETVESGGVGIAVDLERMPDGRLSMAYFSDVSKEVGPCEALGQNPPPKEVHPMRFVYGSSGSWQKETVFEPPFEKQPRGLDLEYTPDGKASIATMTGEPIGMPSYCGVHNTGWMLRESPGSWSTETAVETSGEASTGMRTSDFGEIVGEWASQAFTSSGEPVVAYKDIHQGGRQSIDISKADLELAIRSGGSWSAVPVDWGRGAGNGIDVEVDAQDRIFVSYILPTESKMNDAQRKLGIWVRMSADDGQNWKKVRIYEKPTPSAPATVIDDQGNLHVLFYNPQDGLPILATLDDLSKFEDKSAWKLRAIGSSNHDEGQDPSLVVADDGSLMAAYYRCGAAAGGVGNCQRRDDGLVFAWRDGDTWSQQVVDEGTDAFCGRDPSLTFDQQGRPVIAYACEEQHSGNRAIAVRFALRE